jgi:small ligand-binding sensory domain FIST
MIVGADPTRGSVRLFDDDFAPGMRVTLMLRDTGLMCASAARGSREVTAELAGRASEQLFALYVDCAGRAGYFSGGEVEEADLVRRHFGLDIPLQGCYSGVEFAPSKGRTRATDWNGVLSVFGLVGAS